MTKIRAIRKARHMSGKMLARLTGLSLMSIYRYETGERVPKLDDAVKIARALGVRVEDLIDRK